MVEAADLGPLFEDSEGALEEFEGLVVEKEVLEDDLQVAEIAQIDCLCFSL